VSSFSPVVLRLTRTVFSVLRSERISDAAHTEQRNTKKRAVIRQAVCIEAAVAFTLIFYIGWLCFRGLVFEEPVITSDSMLLGSVLVLVAALGAKLFWIVFSAFQSWLS